MPGKKARTVVLCPSCGTKIAMLRCGVDLTPLKARIFDVIARAGEDGISGTDLRDVIYDRPVSRKLIAVHIHDINAALRSSGFRIRAGSGNEARYRLVRITPEAA